MLNTLLQLGESLSQDRNEWDDIVCLPKYNEADKKGNSITNYIQEICFNLDQGTIECSKEGLREFDPGKAHYETKYFGTLKGNNKAIYASMEPSKFQLLQKTFFGDKKNGSYPDKGELYVTFEKSYPTYTEQQLGHLLQKIHRLNPMFDELFLTEESDKAAYEALSQSYNLGKNEKIILCFISIVCTELGISDPTPLGQLPEYEEFLKLKFGITKEQKKESETKLCYASGQMEKDVEAASFDRGYNLNAMFVSTTKNFLSGFVNKGLTKNYQLSAQSRSLMERASKHLLNNYKVRIAGIEHLIIPQVMGRQQEAIEELSLQKLSHKSELLFQLQELENMTTSLADEMDEGMFWINYVAYESDGNYFKTIGLIKDVSELHLMEVLKAFTAIDLLFRKTEGISWPYKKGFNLQQVYYLIPVRKDTKVNPALNLFKNILEQRPVRSSILFTYFKEYILCHKYKRHGGYANMQAKEKFDYAIQEGVFKYLALLQVLKQLNLIDMEQTEQVIATTEEQPGQVEQFLQKMNYTEPQKALFYLGRVLNAIAYAQAEKGHESKPVLNKLNYNGMKKQDIVRLRIDLADKSRQYKLHGKTEYNMARFHEYFDANNWNMDVNEAVFFLLSGYSFFVKKTQTNSNN